jgi:hypothetical protein
MLYLATKNEKYIYFYLILIEIFIGVNVFSMFFGIFINYFYDDYLENKVKNDMNKSLSFYKLNGPSWFKNSLQYSNEYYKTKSKDAQSDVNNSRKDKANKFIYIILSINFFLLLLVIIPLILGIIPLKYINLKSISINYLMHIVLVIIFEVILLMCILPFIKTVNISDAFNMAKTYNY